MAVVADAYNDHLCMLTLQHGLDRYHYPLLLICKQSGNITQRMLCEQTGRDKVSILRAVDYLQDHEFIERRANKTDRRIQWLVATNRAKQIEPIIEQAIQDTNTFFLGEFSIEEQKTFSKMLTRMLEISRTKSKKTLETNGEISNANDE